MQQQLQMKKKEWQSRHMEELERRRQDWEAEREAMIVTLQKDVNTAFDSRRRQTPLEDPWYSYNNNYDFLKQWYDWW